MMRWVPVVLVPLLAVASAGCLGTGPGTPEQGLPGADGPPAPSLAYVPINESLLSTATYDVLPVTSHYVESTVDGTPLYIEVHRPDTDDPVPTILHSSPYNGGRAPESYVLLSGPMGGLGDYVARGYAVAVADVRGFGNSGGCVEVWGPNEQQDQYDLVQWIANQSWSDGQVALFGASYPGTTPIEAAVMAPPNLTTVVAVAGLTDPYFDWHFGGVPNGESALSPVGYHSLGLEPPMSATTDPLAWTRASADSGCNAGPFIAEAYNPDGVYDDFFRARNLSARAGNIEVPFLYTQGFRDLNVKPSQVLNFFNAIPTPKKALLGPWGHEYPDRDDWDDLLHAWFDYHLLGIDNGVMDGPPVEVVTNQGTWRPDVDWPPSRATVRSFVPTADGTLADAAASVGGAAESELTFTYDRTGATSLATGDEDALVFTSEPLSEDLALAGQPRFHFDAEISEGENVFLEATLSWTSESVASVQEITFGMKNAALRNGYDAYEPLTPGERFHLDVPFQPTEYIVDEESRLHLTISAVHPFGGLSPEGYRPAELTIFVGGEVPAVLELPTVPAGLDEPLPWS